MPIPPKLPSSVRRLLATPLLAAVREACGPQTCLVGGAIRDALLGRVAADVDIVVSGGGRRLAQRLAQSLEARLVDLGGERFASYRLVSRHGVVDLWDRRRQSLEADLRRRDLTVNAIALELGSARLLDPCGGLRDLESRMLRATTEESFIEDPLRVLRLARFAASLDFDIDPDTLELARRSAAAVQGVAIERVRSEVESLVRHPARATALQWLSQVEIYPRLWLPPEAPARADRENAGSGVADLLGELARWTPELEGSASEPSHEIDSYSTSMALIFLAAQLLATDDDAPRRAAARTARESRLLTRRRRAAVAGLIGVERLPSADAEARWFLHLWGGSWRDAALVWAASSKSGSGTDPRRRLDFLTRLALEHGSKIFDPPALVDGKDVARRLALAPGPELGRCLEAVRRAQIEGRITTRLEALEFLKNRDEVDGPR